MSKPDTKGCQRFKSGSSSAWHPERCGKPVVEGSPLCKFHVGVDARRDARYKTRSEEMAKRYAAYDELVAEAKRLSKTLHVKIEADHRTDNGSRFTVPADFLRNLAKGR